MSLCISNRGEYFVSGMCCSFHYLSRMLLKYRYTLHIEQPSCIGRDQQWRVCILFGPNNWIDDQGLKKVKSILYQDSFNIHVLRCVSLIEALHRICQDCSQLCAVYPRRPRSAPFLGALFLVSVSKTELSLEYTQ